MGFNVLNIQANKNKIIDKCNQWTQWNIIE